MAYRVTINTAAYRPLSCTEKNWEPGTINDHMLALNGWTSAERNLTEVGWRLHMFAGTSPGWDVYDSPQYQSWLTQPKNEVVYRDTLCGFDRKTEITPPGFKQGYINIPTLLKTLEQDGRIEGAFSKVYDSRQYLKNMDGCVLIVEEIPREPGEIPAMPVRVSGNFNAHGVNYQLMSSAQKNDRGKYIPNWEMLLAAASCQEEVEYIRKVRVNIESGVMDGFTWNLVYLTKQACGHWEIFQSRCNEHYPLAQVLNQAREHADDFRCTRCICRARDRK